MSVCTDRVAAINDKSVFTDRVAAINDKSVCTDRVATINNKSKSVCTDRVAAINDTSLCTWCNSNKHSSIQICPSSHKSEKIVFWVITNWLCGLIVQMFPV